MAWWIRDKLPYRELHVDRRQQMTPLQLGCREEARELAKKLQTGQVRACFGIRKIGKTSILHRVINEVRANYDCTTILIDAQRDAVFELSAATLINSLAVSVEMCV